MSAAEPRSTFERALARRTDELSHDQAERAAELAQRGSPRGARPRRVTLARLCIVALGLLLARLMLCGAPARRGNEPIGAAAVATADGAGVGSSAVAFLPEAVAAPPTPATPPAATLAPEPTPASRPPARRPAPARVAPAAQADHTPPPRLDETLLLPADDFPTDVAAQVGVAPAPAASTPVAVVNVGTRLRATLEAPLRTGAALAPATAVLAEDVRLNEQTVLKAGTRLAGSAFATPHDDRVQILWRALVHDGRTLAVQAETIGADGAPGVAGKVIRRHRKGVLRRVGGTLAATAGAVAGVAVPLGDGALDQAGAALAGRAGRELGQLGSGRDWLQADTVIELKAGTSLVIYLAADLTLDAPGER